MNKLVSAALIGGTAIAVGVLPAAGIASAATTPPTPILDPAAPSAPATPGTHHTPGHHTGTHHRRPGGHASTGHRSGHGATKHKPGKRKPGGHRSGTGGTGSTGGGSGSPGKAGGATGGGKAGDGTPGTGKTGTGKAGPGKPTPPVTHGPSRHRPIGKPVVHQPPAPTDRILGGNPATDAPWAAQVYWNDVGFQCSGSVIAPQWVLTAGHCVGDNGMSVRVGSLRLGAGTEVNVDDVKVDPNGDMALLHLADQVDTTVAKLADADPQVGATNQIFGWGKTSDDAGPAKRLRMANVKVTDLNCVDGKHGKAICSEGVDGAAFKGDSGGPEMADGVEVGVCSTGDDQAKTQQYASVAANRTWLRQVANV